MGRRRWIALALAGVVAVLSWMLQHPPELGVPARPLTLFPVQVGPWEGSDRKLSERQYGLLETREVLFRDWRHQDGGPPVNACVAVAGGNRKAAHPPHVCYRGQGWKILSRSDRQEHLCGREHSFEELSIAKGGRAQLVWSWYRVGEEETASYMRQQWLGVLADLKDDGTPSALLRFSTPIEALGEEAARHRLRHFLQDVLLPLEAALERRHVPQDSSP